MKLVVNKCFGGFGLSDKAIEMVMNRKGLDCFRYEKTKFRYDYGVDEYTRRDIVNHNTHFSLIYYQTKDLGKKTNKLPNETSWYYGRLERNDADLIAVVEELGKEANGDCSSLKIVEIPDDVEWELDNYDGIETIHEVHRSW